MQNQSNSAPITVVELLKRQIRDWQTAKAHFESMPEQTHQTHLDAIYCEEKINELNDELTRLQS